MIREVHVFFTALMFYTRIPCPSWVDHSESLLNSSSRYFPLIGLLVGALGAVVFGLANLILPFNIAILLSMAATIWITGAFHEDGFGDLCDGLGGGWSVEQRLDIMKDSRMGAFGVIGIGFILAIKFAALTELDPTSVLIALPVAHAFSRLAPVLMMAVLSYVQIDRQSKVKPLATQIGWKSLWFAVVVAVVPLYMLNVHEIIVVIAALIAGLLIMIYFLKTRLGGYTGDGLGATQQLTEVFIYLALCLPTFPVI